MVLFFGVNSVQRSGRTDAERGQFSLFLRNGANLIGVFVFFVRPIPFFGTAVCGFRCAHDLLSSEAGIGVRFALPLEGATHQGRGVMVLSTILLLTSVSCWKGMGNRATSLTSLSFLKAGGLVPRVVL